jgi:hypothetical protein
MEENYYHSTFIQYKKNLINLFWKINLNQRRQRQRNWIGYVCWVWKSVILIDQWSCINIQWWCYIVVKKIYIFTMCRDIERYGGLNSHIRDNMDFQSIYQRKSIVFFFQSSYVDVPRMDYLYYSYFGHARCRTQHPPKVLGLAAQPYPRILSMVAKPDPAAIHPGGHTLLCFWSKFTARGFALSSQSC